MLVRSASTTETALSYPIENPVNKELSHPDLPVGTVGCDSLENKLVGTDATDSIDLRMILCASCAVRVTIRSCRADGGGGQGW